MTSKIDRQLQPTLPGRCSVSSIDRVVVFHNAETVLQVLVESCDAVTMSDRFVKDPSYEKQ